MLNSELYFSLERRPTNSALLSDHRCGVGRKVKSYFSQGHLGYSETSGIDRNLNTIRVKNHCATRPCIHFLYYGDFLSVGWM